MSRENRIEMVNREGWSKVVELKRSIAYVGSQPGADILLPVADVAPRHLQFVPSATNPAGYRVINLGASDVLVKARGGGAARPLAPRATAEIGDGDSVEIAGYTIAFFGGDQHSALIQARVELAGNRLELDRPLEGAIYVRNGGEKAGVQFVVEIQGLEERLVQVDSGPVLFPGVEKRVGFRLLHSRRPTPVAGEHALRFVVTAPDGYPGESAVITQPITIAPFYAHKVRLIPAEQGMSDYVLG